MKSLAICAILLAIVIYVFRTWSVRARYLIPLAIVAAIMAMLEPGRRQGAELYREGVPVKARVESTLCYVQTMDISYSFEVRGKKYTGEYRDWDCGEIAVGEYFDMVYLARAPEIHTSNPGKPSGFLASLGLAAFIYFFLFAMNAAYVQSREQDS